MSDTQKTPLRIWCDLGFESPAREMLDRATRDCNAELIRPQKLAANNLANVGRDAHLADCDIAFGQPHPEDVITSSRLKWVHLSSAGYTRYDNDAVREALRSRGAMMSNSSDVYAEPCAEHVLAFMMCQARALPGAMEAQSKPIWNYAPLRIAVRVLSGERALIVGFGAIGNRLAEMLLAMRMNVSAIRRSPRGDEIVPTRSIDQLDEALAGAGHVLNTLPASSSTAKTFGVSQFAAMPRGAIFYNIGRGDTVDQAALIAALKSGYLAGAYLDVTSPEPLPADHELWRTANCHITPHVGGGMQDELSHLVGHFIKNLRRWTGGQPLINRLV